MSTQTSSIVLGTVLSLWRYPVKSMGGEVLSSIEAGEDGFVGDRAYGLIDVATGVLLSAKRHPKLLEASAKFRSDGEVSINLPTEPGVGVAVASDDKSIDSDLSDWLGLRVRLTRPVIRERSRIEIEFVDQPTVMEFLTRPGYFFDGSVLHVLTTASLASARALYPQGDWRPERFRPNVLVETLAEAGWAEDDWVGKSVEVSGMSIEVTKPCDRCVLVTRAVGGFDADKQILQTLAQHHDANLGIKANVLGVGVVRVGDSVAFA